MFPAKFIKKKNGFILLVFLLVVTGSAVIYSSERSNKIISDTTTGKTNNGSTDNTIPIQNYQGESKKEYEKGLTLFNEKRFEESISLFQTAIDLYKSEPLYFSKKAQAEKNLGRHAESIKTLEEGLKYNPESSLLKTRLDLLQQEQLGEEIE